MIAVQLTVNGTPVSADVEPRQNLADFLREQRLLTGTHLGCEHGVCGACNVLIDGEPARACITLAAVCRGCDVRTIEGLEDDPVMTALRAAFTTEHALQCGYCTPGMLVTAHDIVRRLPDADDARVRLELAGNLCRCTGYMGIVRAIRRVLDARLDLATPVRAPVPAGRFEPVKPDAPIADRAAAVAAQTGGGGERLTQTVRLALPRDAVWNAARDPALIASCVPGARLASVEDGRIAGDLLASLGPIEARFAGTATVIYDDATWSGRIAGQGSDPASGSRLNVEAGFRIDADGPQTSTITLEVTYALRGTLAQLGRGPIVRAFAAEVAANVGRNLEARLRGEAPAAPQRLRGGTLILRAIWRWICGLMSRRRER